jgi:hypothetical protein
LTVTIGRRQADKVAAIGVPWKGPRTHRQEKQIGLSRRGVRLAPHTVATGAAVFTVTVGYHALAMADLRVTCICGAIYEVIQTKDPSEEARPFKCVLCDRELWAQEKNIVGQIRLVWRPEEDRE